MHNIDGVHDVALATNLKNLGLTSNPLVDPPKEVRENGVDSILSYCRRKFAKRLPIGLSDMLVFHGHTN